MNLTRAIFVVNQNVRGILCKYDPAAREGSANDIVFKSLDPTLKKDDIVIVPTKTRVGFTCVKIVEADVSVDVDTGTDMAWIVGKVDTAANTKLLEDEAVVVSKIKKAQDLNRRRGTCEEPSTGRSGRTPCTATGRYERSLAGTYYTTQSLTAI